VYVLTTKRDEKIIFLCFREVSRCFFHLKNEARRCTASWYLSMERHGQSRFHVYVGFGEVTKMVLLHALFA
jgi:hypothetical protein